MSKNRCIPPHKNNSATTPSHNSLPEIQVGTPNALFSPRLSSFVRSFAENTTASRTESTDPLPNPWAPRGAGATARPTATASQTSRPTGNNQEQPAAAPSSNPSASAPGVTTPSMENYMNQFVQNPRLLDSVLNAPYMQPMMDMLAANPEMSRQMIENNPMFANNPELRSQVLNSLPTMMEQMRNPEVQSLMQNREALEAITQIQQGKRRCHEQCKSILRCFVQVYNDYKQLPPVSFKGKDLAPLTFFIPSLR